MATTKETPVTGPPRETDHPMVLASVDLEDIAHWAEDHGISLTDQEGRQFLAHLKTCDVSYPDLDEIIQEIMGFLEGWKASSSPQAGSR